MLNMLHQEEQGSFSTHNYVLKGTAEFNDLFKLIYSVEQSKELKNNKRKFDKFC